MTSFVNLTLDTTAPQITWGGTAGTIAGERFRIGYTIDEPAIEEALLELADGTVLELTDTGTTLECDLPPDATDGWATVRAIVEDDVWNGAERTHLVLIGGVVVVPPETSRTLPTRPRRRRPHPTRRLRATATVRVRARSSSSHAGRAYSAIAISTLAPRVSTSLEVEAARLAIGARGQVTTRRATTEAIRTLGRKRSVTRRDGPDIEALLLLD